MTTTPKQQTDKKRGRPRLDDVLETIPVTVRMTAPQKEKLAVLGGAPWIRDRIDKAKLKE